MGHRSQGYRKAFVGGGVSGWLSAGTLRGGFHFFPRICADARGFFLNRFLLVPLEELALLQEFVNYFAWIAVLAIYCVVHSAHIFVGNFAR